MDDDDLAVITGFRLCPHGYHHPQWPHSCDGCWCEGERDRAMYGWPHDTTPRTLTPNGDTPDV